MHLNEAAADLDSLLIDVKANPRRYINFSVFGGGKKKDKKNK
jgi:phospholipid/cholesterol/gamma-HCH transport system substrate-binding protein